MELLPDMIIIDFCEWLRHFSDPRRSSEETIHGLLFESRNDDRIHDLARDFLTNYHPTIKDMLHQYIDSNYFDDYIHNVGIVLDDCRSISRSDINDFLYRNMLADSFYEFYSERIRPYASYLDSNSDYAIDMLIDSARYRFNRPNLHTHTHNTNHSNNSESMLSFIVNSETELEICTDFLSWLAETMPQPINIFNVSNNEFEELADRFCSECGKSSVSRKKLMHAFRFKNARAFSYKLASKLSLRTVYRAVDLGKIINRYQLNETQFKCFFVVLKANSDEFKSFIYKFGDDLHELSGNYLDIFYSPAEFDKSGYTLTNNMKYIPERLKGKAPIIVLWEKSLENACGIDISGLNAEDLHAIIKDIITLIKEDHAIETIEKEANRMCEQYRKNHRPIIDQSMHDVQVSGTNINIHGTQSIISVNQPDIDLFTSEIQTAVDAIKKATDISIEQQQTVVEILEDTCEAVQTKDGIKQDVCKTRFRDAMVFIGERIIPIISDLATIVSFFGINIHI